MIKMITSTRESDYQQDKVVIKSYQKEGDLEKYCGNAIFGQNGPEYISAIEYDHSRHPNKMFNYHKKHIENYYLTPITINYYKDINAIRSISTESFYNGIWSKSFTVFSKNGGIKEYVEMTWCEVETEDGLNISGFNGNPPGGYYVKFYSNGNKEREGYFEFNYTHGKQSATYTERLNSSELDNLDNDQLYDYNESFNSGPHYEQRSYFKSRLWIYYNEEGDIIKTEDHEKYGVGSRVVKIEDSEILFEDKRWDKE